MKKSLALLIVLSIALGSPAQEPRAPAPLPSEKPQRGGVLRYAIQTDWRSLDPAIAFDSAAAPVQKLLFRGLVDFDDGINVVPDQASDWKISPDGKTYTFHLRPGVRFSNGREVEAEDYVFSFTRILDPKAGSQGQTYLLDILGAKEFNAGKAARVTGLSAPDRRTLVIQLEQPKFAFRYVLAMNFCDVLPRDVVKKYGENFQYHLTGSGPYCIAEWQRNVHYVFKRNQFYNGPESHFDGFDLMIGGDPMLYSMMLERGELDWFQAGPSEAVRFLRDPKLRPCVQIVPLANTDFMFMNMEMKPFTDVRVRRAFNYALDRERLLKLISGFGTVADSVVPPTMPWSNPTLPKYPHDPAKARALLAEAGFPQGFKVELCYPLTPPAMAHLAAGVQQDLHEIGVEVALKPMATSALEVKVGTRRTVPFGFWGWLEDYPDPGDFLDVLLSGERITESDCNNWAFYNNPTVNRLLDEAGRSVNAAERTRLFQEAETDVMLDAPWMPIVHEQYIMLKSPRLRNVRTHPVWLWRYEKIWIEQ